MQPIRKHKARDNAGQNAAGAQNLSGQKKQDTASIRSISHGVQSTPKLDIQTRLTIGKQGDKYEKEADHVAEQVVGPALQRTPSFSATGPPKPALKRPPNITPILHQEEPNIEEAQLQEEEEAASAMEPRFKEGMDSQNADAAPGPQVPYQCSDDLPAAKTIHLTRWISAAPTSPPSTRGPPVAIMQTAKITARAPPRHAFQNLRPHSILCRGPPSQARTKESEGRLEHDLRQSKGGGEPLPEKSRLQMEAGIGADFSGVRVHTDDRAEKMNRMLSSQAFASGSDIYFNRGNFAPETTPGQFLLAHELTHTVQQGASTRVQRSMGQAPPAPLIQAGAPPYIQGVQRFGNKGPRAPPIRTASDPNFQEVHSSLDQGSLGPQIQADMAPCVQGGWIGDKLNDYARHIPGWELFTVIIGYNPLTERDVDRTPRNFLRGFMGLVPGGTLLYDKLDKGGVIDDAFKWLNDQIDDLDLSWTRLRDALDDAWEDMDFIRLDPFDYNIRVLKRYLKPIWEDVKEFGSRVIDKMVELARELLLVPLAEFVKERTRAYPLLSVILGADPITGEEVERNLYNIVSAFLLLTESGEEYLNKLNESGKLLELSEWLDAEIERLNVGPEVVTDAFKRAFELLDLNAVIHPIDTITKLWNIFAGPVTRLFNFVINVAMKVLGLIKDWLLGLLKEYAAKIPGYPLLTVLLEKDPLTGEKVPRTPENFIKGFMSFVPGGLTKFKNLQKSGAISKAFKWLGKAITKLGLIGQALINAFTQMWETFSINDLTNPVAAFERVVAIFTDPVKKIIDFAIEVGLKVLEFIFEGVLGPTGARVLAILKKAKSTFMTIIKDPIKFVKNLIDAVMKGFNQFKSNILKHLKAGLIGWLVGTLGKAGVKLPEKWDLAGIVSFVLGILGLTYDRIRPKLVKVLGEKTVGILETTFEVVMLLFTEGPGAVWEKFLEYMDNLKEKVMGGIRDWVITKVVTSAVTKIATMLNPAGAVIQAIIATYNTVMFFIERINQILDLVESVVNSIAKIAAGKIDDAANFVEQAMARTIPVIISFLARLLGLGNIAGTIQKIIKKLQGAVDKALDKVIAWIVKQAKRLIKAGKSAVAKIFSWWRAKTTFKDKGGNDHEIFFKGKDAKARLMIASSPPETFTDYIKLITPQTPAEKTAYANAKKIATKIDGMQQTQTTRSASGKYQHTDVTPDFQKEVENLAKEVAKIKMKGKIPPSSPIKFSGLTTERYGTGVEVEKLTKINTPGGEPTVSSSSWRKLLLRKPKSGGGSLYVRGHLLNHNIGGPGNNWQNLTPITQDANNRAGNSMLKAFEDPVKKSVEAGNAVHFKVTPDYSRPTPAVLSKLTPVPTGKAADYAMIKDIATEEANIPLNIVCYAKEYDPTSDDKTSAAPNPQLPSGTAPLTKTVPNDIDTGKPDDYALETTPKPDAGRIDDSVGMQNAGVPAHQAKLIEDAVREINLGDGKRVNSIGVLKAAVPAIAGEIQKFYDENQLVTQTDNPFTQSEIEDHQRKIGKLAPENVFHAYYKLSTAPTAQIFNFSEIGAYIGSDPDLPRRMWNNEVALYVQGKRGRTSRDALQEIFHALDYEPDQYQGDVQSKKEVSSSGDIYEREADNVADHVVGERAQLSPLPSITPLSFANRILRSKEAGTSQESPQLSGDLGRSSGAGTPLSTGVRKQMEQGIGGDFSGVRIHTDSNAGKMSRSIHAQAFTTGSDIYFGEGKFQPEAKQGKHLLAHELTHVVQQNEGIRRKPVETSQTTEKPDNGPLVLGNMPVPGLEPAADGIKPRGPPKAEKKTGKTKAEKKTKTGGKGKPAKKAAGAKEKGKKTKKTGMPPSLGKRSVPKIKSLKSGGSDAMMMDFMKSTASKIAATYPTLGTAVSGAMKAEKQREKSSAPKLTAKIHGKKAAGKAGRGEEPKGKEAKIEETTAPGVPAKKLPEHKNLVGAPENNKRIDRAMSQGPFGSFLSWFKQRFGSFMSSIKTGSGVNTNAGERPKTDLSGDADPKRSDSQREQGDRQANGEKDKVAAGIRANLGKDEIQPVAVDETNDVRIEAAAGKVTTEKQDDMADYLAMPLPEAVRKKTDMDMAPLLNKSLAKPRQDVKNASTKRNEDKKAETANARKKAEKLNENADKNQKNLVDQSRGEVADEQKKGLDEADGFIRDFRKEAGEEQKTLKEGIEGRVKADEGKAAKKLAKAEKDAEKEKKKEEKKAAVKKKELKKKSKKRSWWDRVKSAVKSVVKAITKAIDVIFTALRKAVKFIIETAKKAALAVIEAGRKWIVDKLNKFRKWIKDKVTKYIGKVFPELAKKINKAIDKVVDKAIEGVNKVADTLKKGVEALANALGKILDKILSVFQTALKAAVQIAGAALTGDFAEIAKVAFYSACDILGIDPKSVIDFMERAGDKLIRVFKSPSTFFNNVARGVKKGLDQFKEHSRKHLVNGLIKWLTGNMGDIQITLPEKFDLKGIFSLVMQILGLTYDNIRAKVVKKLGPRGEEIVGFLEKSFTLVKDLVTRGPVALWERVKEKLSSLKAQAMEAIKGIVITEVIKAGIFWMVSLLNPASALVKAIKMLYDLVMFFIERWDSIVAFAKSVWDSVNALASGQIGQAANAVEQALARAIPMILGLLASLLSLGGIGKSVRSAIEKISQPIDFAVEKVVGFIVDKGRALFNKITGKGKEKGVSDKPREKQSPEEQEKNKKAAEKKIRAIMTKGTTLGKFRKEIPKLKKKYKVLDIKIIEGFDVKVFNSDPALIKVDIAHDIDLTKEGKLAEAAATGRGPAGEPKYDKPTPKEEFTFGSFKAQADHPETLKAVLARELSKHKLTLVEIEYNKYFSGFPDAPARPQKVDATIYGYIAGKIGSDARTGVSAIVGKMGNREASFRKKQYKAQGVTYDGGHLVGHSFGGPDAYYNLVPMKARINREVYGRIERFMRDQVKVEPGALPLDKKKSNLDLSVSLNYGDPSYNVDMPEFLKVATAGLKSEKQKLKEQEEQLGAKKEKLEDIKAGLPKDPLKAVEALKKFQAERNAKKKRLKELRKTEEQDLLVWNLVKNSGLMGLGAKLKEKKFANAQVANAQAIIAPLDKLIAGLTQAVPGHLLINALKNRRRVINKFIDEYARDYKLKPRHKEDTRLAFQGVVLRAHLRGLQQPRDLTRSLEKELAKIPTVPKDLDIDAKIRDYDERIQHAITELKRTDQKAKLKTLEGKSFLSAPNVSVNSRIPHSFSVEVDYEAVPAQGGGHKVKDAKGNLKEFKKSEFQTPSGLPKESYGTIKVSDASPDTKIILEKLAPKRDKATTRAAEKPEKEEFTPKIGDKYKISLEKRFRTTFTISQ